MTPRSAAGVFARVRGRLRRMFPRPTWEGVYQRYADVPARGGHERDFWIKGTVARTEEAMRRRGGTEDALPLVVVAGMVLRAAPRVRILDVGGGMGIAYVALRRSLGAGVALDHTVAELPRVCEVGRTLFEGDRSIRFVAVRTPAELPPGEFDVVYACGVLQYLEDPFDGLRRLLAYRAPYVVVSVLPAGDNPTYVTAQLNLRGSVVPCWMFRLSDVESVVRDAGYVVRARAWSDMSLLRAYRTNAIPRDHRPERMVTLLLTDR
ncbi:MAG: methyltransferase, TIGR04325 family [Chloroflexota bacterium]|nr:methyltransferase, TIGR04325 family [Chloroflexota bacterium]